MRIRCPSCAATYEVADALLDPPRTVRCAKCAHDWVGVPVVDAPPAEPEQPPTTPEPSSIFPPARVPAPGPEPAFVRSAPTASVTGDTPLSSIERLGGLTELELTPRRRDRWLTAAWAASFAALTALGVAGYTERELLMKQWPASKRVYATLGLASSDAKPGEKDAARTH